MKRVISMLLAAALVATMIVPVSASSASGNSGVLYDSSFYNALDRKLSSSVVGVVTKGHLWHIISRAVSYVGVGSYASLSDLSRACVSINHFLSSSGAVIWDYFTDFDDALLASALGCLKGLRWEIQASNTYGYVIAEEGSGVVLCDLNGAFPYYKPAEGSSSTPSSDGYFGGIWLRAHYAQSYSEQCVVLSEAALESLASDLSNTPGLKDYGFRCYTKLTAPNSTLRAIYLDMDNVESYIYCNKDGLMYVAQVGGGWAVNTPNNYYTEPSAPSGGNTSNDTTIIDQGDTINNTVIDQTNNTVWFPDGTLNYIDQLIYDQSTKTYMVDSHDSYTWNETTNNYVTVNNNFHYEYHINYTSITYIGSTAEYDKVYELYYELPDGRSSADLTADELQALNLAVDVIPYIRSADDTSIRALYHFDADTLDSSYWNYLGKLTWAEGASITYMDANAFNGALYLDENAHDFTITLPSSITSGDFTLQFRYYQSYTAAPQLDSYIQLGNSKVMQFNGSGFYNGSGSKFASTSVGNWQDVCLMRKDGVLYYFINGVNCGSVADLTSYSPDIRFYFGSKQQTYKYFDEFRFLNKAIYSLSGYTPSSVPFDTNLSLVLPDSKLPVADEYWEFTSSKTNLLAQYGLDMWGGKAMTESPYLSKYVMSGSYDSYYSRWNFSDPPYFMGGSSARFPQFYYDPTFTLLGSYPDSGFISTAQYTSGSYTLPLSAAINYANFPGSSDNSFLPTGGIYSMLEYSHTYIESVQSFSTLPDGTYTLSMVAADGSVGSVTFTLPFTDPMTSVGYSSHDAKRLTVFNGYEFGLHKMYVRLVRGWSSSGNELYSFYGPATFLVIRPTSYDTQNEFLYLELVEGSSTDLKAEKISSVVVMDADSLDTPTLAVRTSLNITGYQIGGVRPSLPKKGFVWALVESGRITSLQIYNGQAWQAVDGRIWTGERWIPYYAYDILLLKDMYDIIEADPSQDPIYTESGFWSWLQRAWAQMISLLQSIRDAILSLTGLSPGDSSEAPPEDPEDPTPDPEDYTGIVHLLRVSYNFFSGFFVDFTVGGIENYILFFTDENSDAFKIFDMDWGS